MNIKTIFQTIIFTLLLSITLFTSCKKDNIKSPSELYAEEMAILERFKETETYKGWFDEADMVIDSSDASGLVYFELEKGTGDTVQLSKKVGIRYSMYYILDSVGAKEPYLAKFRSIVFSADPIVYYVGKPDPNRGIYVGLDLGIRYMCAGTLEKPAKSRMLFPSTIGGNDYVSRVMEVNITYMGK